MAGLEWANALELLRHGPQHVSVINAAAAVCGGLRSSSPQSGATRQRNWFWSCCVFQSASKAEVELDMVSFNAMVGASTSAGWERTLLPFTSLEQEGLRPDNITFSFFSALPWFSALQLLTQLAKQNLKVSAKSASAAAAAARPARWQLCLNFVGRSSDEDQV